MLILFGQNTHLRTIDICGVIKVDPIIRIGHLICFHVLVHTRWSSLSWHARYSSWWHQLNLQVLGARLWNYAFRSSKSSVFWKLQARLSQAKTNQPSTLVFVQMKQIRNSRLAWYVKERIFNEGLLLCFYLLRRRIACIFKVDTGWQAAKPLNSTEQLGESNEPEGLCKASLSDFKEKETRQFVMKQKLPVLPRLHGRWNKGYGGDFVSPDHFRQGKQGRKRPFL